MNICSIGAMEERKNKYEIKVIIEQPFYGAQNVSFAKTAIIFFVKNDDGCFCLLNVIKIYLKLFYFILE